MYFLLHCKWIIGPTDIAFREAPGTFYIPSEIREEGARKFYTHVNLTTHPVYYHPTVPIKFDPIKLR